MIVSKMLISLLLLESVYYFVVCFVKNKNPSKDSSFVFHFLLTICKRNITKFLQNGNNVFSCLLSFLCYQSFNLQFGYPFLLDSFCINSIFEIFHPSNLNIVKQSIINLLSNFQATYHVARNNK